MQPKIFGTLDQIDVNKIPVTQQRLMINIAWFQTSIFLSAENEQTLHSPPIKLIEMK